MSGKQLFHGNARPSCVRSDQAPPILLFPFSGTLRKGSPLFGLCFQFDVAQFAVCKVGLGKGGTLIGSGATSEFM